VAGGGGVGLHPPGREAPAHLGHDPDVGPAGLAVQEVGVGLHEAGHEVGEGRLGTEDRAHPAALVVDRAAPPGQHGEEQALAGAEVVADGRRVALPGRLGDLAGGDTLVPDAGEQPLCLVEQPPPRAVGDARSRVSPRAGGGRWWGSR
jgi:hypothetical protein